MMRPCPTLTATVPQMTDVITAEGMSQRFEWCGMSGSLLRFKILHPQRAQSFHFLRIYSLLIRPDSQRQSTMRRRGRQLILPLGQNANRPANHIHGILSRRGQVADDLLEQLILTFLNFAFLGDRAIAPTI